MEIGTRLSAADPSSTSLQRDVGMSLERLGDVLVRQGDSTGAKQRTRKAWRFRTRLSAADPSSASLQRDVSVSLWKLAGITGSGVSWQQVAEVMEAMQARGILKPADTRFLDEARKKAAAEAAKR